MATQQETPWQRCRALLIVAIVEIRLDNRNSASETLALARQEAMAASDPAARCLLLLSVLQAEFANNQNRGYLTTQMGALFDLAEPISAARLRTHVLGELAGLAEDYGLSSLHNRCVAHIQKDCLMARESLERRSSTFSGTSYSPFPSSCLEEREPLDALVEGIGLLELWDQPNYLPAVARADGASWANDTYVWGKSPAHHHSPTLAQIAAYVLYAAMARSDQAMCERLGAILVKQAVRPETDLLEALAEAGQADTALTPIADQLVATADVSHLRQALARRAGRRGDLDSIERAASPIRATGHPAKLGDCLNRTTEGLKYTLARAATPWLLRLRVSGVDMERIQIYVEGYRGLQAYDVRHAESFLAEASRKLGSAGGGLLQRLLVEDMGKIADTVFVQWTGRALTLLNRLISLIDRLSGVHRARFAEARVDYWLAHADFDQAVAVAKEVEEQIERSYLLVRICQALLGAGQLGRALDLADACPVADHRLIVMRDAMSYLADRARPQAAGWIDRLMAGLGTLGDPGRLAESPALPALVTALTAHVPVTQIRAPLEPLGPTALLAACEPLAAATAGIEAERDAVETGQALLAWLEAQPPPVPRIKAACAPTRCWAPRAHLAAMARRAYEMALGDAHHFRMGNPPEAYGKLDRLSGQCRRGSSPLDELAMAARALGDRRVLLDLWGEARKIVGRGYPMGLQDNALVDIAAGLGGLGETLRYGCWGWAGHPAWEKITWSYRQLAGLEIAAAMRGFPPEKVYQARRASVLSAAVDWALAKLKERLDGGSKPQPVPPWRKYRSWWAEEQLVGERKSRIEHALYGLPDLRGKWPDRRHSYRPRQKKRTRARFPRSRLFTRESGGDAQLGQHMVATLAAEGVHDGIPRVVLAAQQALQTTGKRDRFWSPRTTHITREEFDAIVDAALAALLTGGQAALAHDVAQLVSQPSASVQARLAATDCSEAEAETILTQSLEQAWNATTVAAVAETAAAVLGRAARLTLATQILSKARIRRLGTVLEALGIKIDPWSARSWPPTICTMLPVRSSQRKATGEPQRPGAPTPLQSAYPPQTSQHWRRVCAKSFDRLNR